MTSRSLRVILSNWLRRLAIVSRGEASCANKGGWMSIERSDGERWNGVERREEEWNREEREGRVKRNGEEGR